MQADLDRMLHDVSALDGDLGQRLRRHLERSLPDDPFDGLWRRILVTSVAIEDIVGETSVSPYHRVTLEAQVSPGDCNLLYEWMHRQWRGQPLRGNE